MLITSSKVLGYSCSPGYMCSTSGGCVPVGSIIYTHTDSEGRHCAEIFTYCGAPWDCTGSSSDGTCNDSRKWTWYNSWNDCYKGVNARHSGCCVPGNECTPKTSCPDSTCTDSGYSASSTSYWTITKKCSDGCSGELNKTCYCTGDCSLQSCEAGTSTNETVDIYDTYSCTNDCSKPNSKSCYCDICTPPLCGPAYEISDQGYGNTTLSCRNGVGAPEQATKCDLTNRTCYCRDCLKACPLPLEETEQYIFKGYNLGGASTLKLEDFRRCTNDCNVGPNESNDDCYEVESRQPDEAFSIVDPGDVVNPPNGYDFKSITHTGIWGSESTRKKDLNDPTLPLEMVATYTDPDGASDIEGMFVWFRHESLTDPVLGTPVHISESATPQGPALNSWGFMLKRSGSGWLPYVTSYQPTTPVWTRTYYDHYPDIPEYAKFYLRAPNQTNMIEVTVIPAPLVSADGKSITIKFSLRFTNDGASLGSNAAPGLYNIYLMGLDKFSFTPFDNYDVAPDLIDFATFWDSTYLLNGENFTHYWSTNQLRYIDGVQGYAKAWHPTGNTWTLDFTNPRVVSLTKSISGNKINVAWEVNNNGDGRDLYSVVGNIYSSGTDLERKPVNIDINSFSHTISLINGTGIFTPPSSTGSNAIVGKLNSGWSFKVEPSNLNSVTNTGSISIDVGDNTKGFIYIYLHVFDYAGNVVSSSVSENMLDRFLTGGGLSFSPSTTFAQLTPLDDSLWSGVLPPYANPSEGLLRKNAGLTSEMYANLGNPLNSIQAKSYGITGFTNWLNTTSSLYDSLLRKYELHKKYIPVDKLFEYTYPNSITINNTTISNLLSCNSTKDYCTFFVNGNLGVSNVRCNKRTLVFVQGNLTITPPFDSDNAGSISNLNGCIFVVGGTVTIAPNPAVSGTFSYDRINAFIVSDGVITIAHDPDASTIVDGVYINGGLISKGGGDSIDIKRYLRLEERLVYPVFAIDLHPKYGILAEKFFGNSYVIQSTEVGLKPY